MLNKWFQKEKINNLSSLLRKTSDLMDEGYQVMESLLMLLPYFTKEHLKWENKIQKVIDDGSGVTEIFKQLGVQSEFLLTIYFAEKHGSLAKTLKQISLQMNYKNVTQKQIKKLLAYPISMFVLLITFFICFRIYFLPNISQVLITRQNDDLSTIKLSNFLLHIPDLLLVIIGICFSLVLISINFLKRKHVQIRLQYLMKIPLVHTFYKLNLTRVFARNLGNLIIAGFTIQEALYELKQQQFKSDIQYIAKTVENKVIHGMLFSEIVAQTPYFFHKFELFVKHGEQTGLLGRELILYCDILDEKLKTYLKTIMAFIQPLSFVLIAICIIAAYLSILLPMYKMIDII